jgi:ribosomal protein L37AE/L43A
MTDAMVCEDCGRTLPERYGRWFPIIGAAVWLCHHCADLRRELHISPPNRKDPPHV